VQAHHASVLARSRKLNDAPLLTAKHRDAAVAEREKKKADKWPTVSAA
jgi:tether containing UBX domain for GLUT4